MDDRIALGAVPDVKIQFRGIAQFFADLTDQVKLPFETKLYEALVCRHIDSLVREGLPTPIKMDVLIVGSGAEWYHRLISTQAQYYKIPIIRVHHGEGFGIADEPIFGIGEQAYTDVLIGYGPFFDRHKDDYDYLVDLLWTPRYVPSSSEIVVRNHVRDLLKPLKFAENLQVCYFPTSLSGYTHRYGPYRDLPDKLYLEWHNQVKEWFGPLTIKAHPKEKYSALFRKYHQSYITANLRKIIDEVDVFIFDYISSAFFIAAATDKPIIFLDLGLRNISKIALPYVKERTHYVDIREHHSLNKVQLMQLIQDGRERKNQLSEPFSLEETRRSRVEVIVEQIQKMIQPLDS